MEYRFSLIVAADLSSDEEMIDLADALGEAGCLDATVRGHASGAELLFDRDAATLQLAITSAVADAERAGLTVVRVEMEQDMVPE